MLASANNLARVLGKQGERSQGRCDHSGGPAGRGGARIARTTRARWMRRTGDAGCAVTTVRAGALFLAGVCRPTRRRARGEGRSCGSTTGRSRRGAARQYRGRPLPAGTGGEPRGADAEGHAQRRRSCRGGGRLVPAGGGGHGAGASAGGGKPASSAVAVAGGQPAVDAARAADFGARQRGPGGPRRPGIAGGRRRPGEGRGRR